MNAMIEDLPDVKDELQDLTRYLSDLTIGIERHLLYLKELEATTKRMAEVVEAAIRRNPHERR